MTPDQPHISVASSNAAHEPENPLLAGMLDLTPHAVMFSDAAEALMGWNTRCAALFGPALTLDACPLSVLTSALSAPTELIDGVTGNRSVDSLADLGTHELQLGGSIHILRGPIRDDDTGETIAIAWTLRLVCEERGSQPALAAALAAERLAFLGCVATKLGASIDFDQTLDVAVDAPLGVLADYAAVYLPDADGIPQPVAVRHVDDRLQETIQQVAEMFKPHADQPWGISAVMKTGCSDVLEPLGERFVETIGRGHADTGLLSELGNRAIMMLPLTVRARTIGVLVLGHTNDEVLTTGTSAEEIAVATQYADRVAAAIDNAQMYLDAERRGRAVRVLQHVGDGVFLVDDTGVVSEWNTAAGTILGIAEDQAIGAHIEQVVPGWIQLRNRIAVATAGQHKRVSAVTLPVVTQDGQVWIAISGVRIEDGIAYAFRDVTSEHELERMKTDFVATVSHELRTPLASVYGSAITLQRSDLPLDDEVRAQLLAIIANEAYRLGSIVNDILAASHIDSGQVQIAARAFDPVRIAKAVVESARARSADNERVRGDLPEAGEIELIGDHDRLHQVLVNLVENAIKYSPDGGDVVVSLRADRVRRIARFDVRDSGLGIPERDQQHIFDKFYRLDPHQTRGVGGTGLGLYICRELVVRMGGELSVESAQGVGSTFTVELPLVP